MLWVEKIWLYFLGGLYLSLALALLVLFVPALVALFIALLSVCVFNVNFFKRIAIASFTRSVSLLSSLLGEAAASFRAAKTLGL